METFLILHNIRSVYNTASLFRTADAAGVTKIYCTGYTPTPIDRFSRKRDDFAKVALGAEETVAWEKREKIIPLIEEMKEGGICTIAVEQTDDAIDYRKHPIEESAAFILGNEVDGLPQVVCETADVTIEIPMHGAKASLNVSVAGGVVLFENLKKD